VVAATTLVLVTPLVLPSYSQPSKNEESIRNTCLPSMTWGWSLNTCCSTTGFAKVTNPKPLDASTR